MGVREREEEGNLRMVGGWLVPAWSVFKPERTKGSAAR